MKRFECFCSFLLLHTYISTTPVMANTAKNEFIKKRPRGNLSITGWFSFPSALPMLHGDAEYSNIGWIFNSRAWKDDHSGKTIPLGHFRQNWSTLLAPDVLPSHQMKIILGANIIWIFHIFCPQFCLELEILHHLHVCQFGSLFILWGLGGGRRGRCWGNW